MSVSESPKWASPSCSLLSSTIDTFLLESLRELPQQNFILVGSPNFAMHRYYRMSRITLTTLDSWWFHLCIFDSTNERNSRVDGEKLANILISRRHKRHFSWPIIMHVMDTSQAISSFPHDWQVSKLCCVISVAVFWQQQGLTRDHSHSNKKYY